MKRIACAAFAAAALLFSLPAHAVTNQDGQVLITQAAVNAGNITPGDTPGFPVTISVGGSYRLASNLVVTTAVNGIEVRANEVTIDMGGFTLAGSGVGRNGIASFNRALRVEHGNVRGFTLDGIRSIAQFLTVHDMIVVANGRDGVFAHEVNPSTPSADFARITDSNISSNGDDGISCASHCHVEGNTVSKNESYGVYCYADGGCTVLGNTLTLNGGAGIGFLGKGGAGNNTIIGQSESILGQYVSMQPNACSPSCFPP